MADIKPKRKRKVSIIHESSSSADETTPFKHVKDETNQTNTPRSSERLQKKRCRAFRKPSREDVWNKITPTKSPGKYEQLRPKHLVNNFTKENSSYNYDPNETSGDESMNDFLDDSFSEQSSSQSDSSRDRLKHKKQVRIKGRRRRLQNNQQGYESSSTESNDERVTGTNVTYTKDVDVTDNNNDDPSGDSAICVRSCNKRNLIIASDSSENDDIKEDLKTVTTSKTRKHNRSVIESDDNDMCESKGDNIGAKRKQVCRRLIDESDDTSDNDENIAVTIKHNRSIIKSDKDDYIADKADGNVKSQDFCKSDSEGNAEDKNDIIDDNDGLETVEAECNPPNTNSNNLEMESTNSTGVSAVETMNHSKNETNSGDSENNSEVTSDESSEDSNGESDENICNSSRVRVQMLRKKNDRKKLFDKFRAERQRKLAKEH